MSPLPVRNQDCALPLLGRQGQGHGRGQDVARAVLVGQQHLEHIQETTYVLWTYSSQELFELLVLRRGWSPERFGGFVANGISAALLPPQTFSD
jgi:hypothetical protein